MLRFLMPTFNECSFPNYKINSKENLKCWDFHPSHSYVRPFMIIKTRLEVMMWKIPLVILKNLNLQLRTIISLSRSRIRYFCNWIPLKQVNKLIIKWLLSRWKLLKGNERERVHSFTWYPSYYHIATHWQEHSYLTSH